MPENWNYGIMGIARRQESGVRIKYGTMEYWNAGMMEDA
jgi:hypothetical protein